MKEPLALSLRGYHAAASILIKTEQGAINFERVGKLIKEPHISDSVFVPRTVSFPPYDGSAYLDIFLQFSTPSPIRLGLWVSPEIGHENSLRLQDQKKQLADVAVLAILVFMALYHFTLVQQRRKDRASLWFGFAALAYATMVFYGSQILINWVESDIGIWTGYLYKITSIAGLVLVVALGNLYLAIFRLLLLERVMRALTWFAIGTGGVILILGLPVFERFRYVWDFVVLVALILAVADIVKRSIKRERFLRC